ncbi:metallophosphoesterase family protein [Halomonas aquamarina]|uniref:Metallophosphoesterase family protein n=1 Tax=Vreelandella aquamarina TaxID=77097 RepID=A0ACC5VTW9_9GAMM|nr:metallophosphoesterase [Halomonas aquamarina]MBZ5487320.1 metallophosphoesterase family protein [Halomonas aquamarina]
MRLHVLSDLHLEHFPEGRALPDVEADALVLAGDIHETTRGLGWARARFPDRPILFVPGNHEFYGTCLPEHRRALALEAERLDIELLDNRAVMLGGVRFLGTTLWTDFQLYVGSPGCVPQASMDKAVRVMPDFQIITDANGEAFTPRASQALHREALDWLVMALDEPFDGPTVVISHHAPLRECIPLPYVGDILSPAFASHLPYLMGRMNLWIHGHVHEAVDLQENGTRVVANPGGYPEEVGRYRFREDLTITI